MMSALPLQVLIVEDRADDADLMVHNLRQSGYEVDWQRVDSEPDYLAHLNSALDLILADHEMPLFDSGRALRLLQESGLDIPFIIVSGVIDEDAAVFALKQGAADYLLKDRLARLGEAVRHALQQKELRNEKQRAEDVLHRYAKRLEILHQIDLGIINASSIPQVVEAALTHIQQLIPCQRVILAVVDNNADEWLTFALAIHSSTDLGNGTRVRIPPDWFEGFNAEHI